MYPQCHLLLKLCACYERTHIHNRLTGQQLSNLFSHLAVFGLPTACSLRFHQGTVANLKSLCNRRCSPILPPVYHRMQATAWSLHTPSKSIWWSSILFHFNQQTFSVAIVIVHSSRCKVYRWWGIPISSKTSFLDETNVPSIWQPWPLMLFILPLYLEE